MSVSLTVNGVAFDFPQPGDTDWGADVTAWATAISASSLYKAGGAFTLTAEVDFGGVAGLKALYLKSRTANSASAGQVRLARADAIKWRNQANSADLELAVNASNQLTFQNVPLATSQVTVSDTGTIDLTLTGVDLSADVIAASLTNTHIAPAAAIAYSKLNLAASIVNADIAGAAAIAYSKLNLAGSIVNADVSASAAVAYSKLNLADSIVNADVNASAAIAYSKLNLATSIVNADVSAAAAIALSKLAAGTANRAAQFGSGGILEPSTVTSTELSFLATGNLRELIFSEDGASAGPTFRLTRVSASPAASDGLALIDWSGRNSTPATIVYNRLAGFLVDPTAGSEDSYLSGQVRVAGALTEVLRISAGGIELPLVTASRALVSGSGNAVEASAVTATELGRLTGVTAAVQTQINEGPPPLATFTPSGAASVDIVSVIDSSKWTTYEIFFDLVVSVDDAAIWVRVDSSNGASFDSGAGDYSYAGAAAASTGTPTAPSSNADSKIVITGIGATFGVGNATNEHATGRIYIDSLGSGTTYPVIGYHSGHLDTATRTIRTFGNGSRLSAAAINAIQILPSTGTITGTVRVYGRKNA